MFSGFSEQSISAHIVSFYGVTNWLQFQKVNVHPDTSHKKKNIDFD